MAQPKGSTSREGLSLQTLVIAAAASAVAAVVVSHVWKGGTVIAAAMTPVIVSIMKEVLARPMESEIVKKPVQQVSKIASGRIVASATPRAERVRQAGKSFGDEPFTAAPPPPPTERRTRTHTNGDSPRPDVIESHPRRTYGAPARRSLHLKVAIITGLLAFVIAALVLTVPELVFGGAVSSHHSTTLFGGGSKHSAKKKVEKTSTDKNTTTQPSAQQPQSQQTTPTTPSATTPSSTTPQAAPTPTTPQSSTPPAPQSAPPPTTGGTTPPSP